MASERTGVYPGTFDPITSGHMEVMRRSLRLVDKLVIGCAINIGKGPLFSLEERMEIIRDLRLGKFDVLVGRINRKSEHLLEGHVVEDLAYLPPRELYGTGIYQETIVVVAPGSLEQVIEAVAQRIKNF